MRLICGLNHDLVILVCIYVFSDMSFFIKSSLISTVLENNYNKVRDQEKGS